MSHHWLSDNDHKAGVIVVVGYRCQTGGIPSLWSQCLKKAWRPVGDCLWLSLVPRVSFSALTRLVEAIG